jgi:hypothetical protein
MSHTCDERDRPRRTRKTVPGSGTLLARGAAVIVAAVSGLALTAMPMAHADEPPKGKLCDQSQFQKAHPKYCAKQWRAYPVEAHPPAPTLAVATEIRSSR